MFLNIVVGLVGVEKPLCLRAGENLFKMELNRREYCSCAADSLHVWKGFFVSHFDCDALNLETLCKRASALIPGFANHFEVGARDVPAQRNHNPPLAPAFLCRYLHKPYLIGGKKFDLRIYVYVTCYDPLRVYLFKDGLVRFASCK